MTSMTEAPEARGLQVPPEVMLLTVRSKLAQAQDQVTMLEGTVEFQYSVIEGLQQQLQALAAEQSIHMHAPGEEPHTHEDPPADS